MKKISNVRFFSKTQKLIENLGITFVSSHQDEKLPVDINKHIIDNLEYYLNLKNTEYAFLITGAWGTGKTFFITSFIDKYDHPERKILKISLFGLSSTSQIDQKIFEGLHPILGSKYAKVMGNAIKGAISLGFRMDLNSDGSPDSTLNAKFDKLSLVDYLPGSKNKPMELVLVFDDLERTNISLREMLGFINYMVEVSGVKVIIVANESYILEGDNKKIYSEFKEKVIGKTFEVKHDVHDFLIHLFKDKKSVDFNNHAEIIKDIYTKSKFKNLRNIKQSLDDFEFFISFLDKEYVDNNEFYSNLLVDFLSLSLEIKQGNLDENDLISNAPFKGKSEKNCIYEKYFSTRTSVFDGQLWSDVLLRGDFSEVNGSVSKLAYFLEEKNHEVPFWLKLWNFTTLDEEDFQVSLKKLEDDLVSLTENETVIYLHKLALIIYFSKNNLASLGIEEIKSLVNLYVDRYKSSEKFNNKITSDESQFNGTGYSYLNFEDKDFIALKSVIINQNKLAHDCELSKQRQAALDELVESIKQKRTDYYNEFFLQKYQYTPILQEIDSSKIAEALMSGNSALSDFNSMASRRYSKNHYLNDLPIYKHLRRELKFWQELNVILCEKLVTKSGIEAHVLDVFIKSTVKEVISLLSEN